MTMQDWNLTSLNTSIRPLAVWHPAFAESQMVMIIDNINTNGLSITASKIHAPSIMNSNTILLVSIS